MMQPSIRLRAALATAAALVGLAASLATPPAAAQAAARPARSASIWSRRLARKRA
jgi:hypothetical protein